VKVIYFVRTIILRKTTTGLLQWVSIVENELVLSTQRLFEKMLFGCATEKRRFFMRHLAAHPPK
jgi:hypothetical protein